MALAHPQGRREKAIRGARPALCQKPDGGVGAFLECAFRFQRVCQLGGGGDRAEAALAG